MTDLLGRVVTATLVADAGGALGATFGRIGRQRLSLLVWIAAGSLLAVTLCDVLPEALSQLSIPMFLLATASGVLLLWLVSRYIFVVCPACAVGDLDHDRLHVGSNALLLTIALAIHSFMDGLGVVASEGLHGHADYSLLLGLSIHKLPEGLALAVLLLGAGVKPWQSLAITAGVESATVLGGLFGISTVHAVSPAWVAAVAANVAGGFLFLVATALRSVLSQKDAPARWTAGIAAFIVTAACVLGTQVLLNR